MVGLRGLETLRNTKRDKEAQNAVEPRVEEESGRLVGGGVHHAEETRIGYENCLTAVMPTLLKTGFYGDHTGDKVTHQNFNNTKRRRRIRVVRRLPTRGRFSHTRGTVSKKAGKVIALYNGSPCA